MLVIEFSENDETLVESILKESAVEAEIARINRYDGQGDIIQALIYISSATIPIIAKVIIVLIQARKNVSVKYKGLEIKGISENNIINILQQIEKKKSGIKK